MVDMGGRCPPPVELTGRQSYTYSCGHNAGYPDAIPTAEYWTALARKNALMWNATRKLYPAVSASNISYYSRGGVHWKPELNATECLRGRGKVPRAVHVSNR